MKKSKWLGALLLLGASTSRPTPAHAADISVYVSDAFITSKIDGAINGYIQAQASQLDWLAGVTRVETSASGIDDTTLHVRLNVSYQVPGTSLIVPVDIDFDVLLGCGEGGPYALIDHLSVTTLVPVPPQVGAQIQAEANRMLTSRAQAILDPIWQKLGSLPQSAIVRQVCPHFEVGASGDLYVEVDFLKGCITGRQKNVRCGSRFTGDGYDYACINGYWKKLGGFCEPAAPPGGQRP